MSFSTEPTWKEAQARGAFIVEGTPTRLLCDLDDDLSLKKFIAGASNTAAIERFAAFPSATKDHFHGYALLKQPMELEERLLMQAVLGSDINFITGCRVRGRNGAQVTVALIEAPEQFYAVHQWLHEGKTGPTEVKF